MDGTAKGAERRLQRLAGRNVRVCYGCVGPCTRGLPPMRAGTDPSTSRWWSVRSERGFRRPPTCQRGEREMLRLAALPFAVNDAEVDFDGVAHGRVSVGRNLHKQHILESSSVSGMTQTGHTAQAQRPTGWLLSLSTDASISQIC